MITIRQLKIYEKYSGNIDSWARLGSELEHEYMFDKDWLLIDGLMQDISRIRKGVGSFNYQELLDKRLIDYCDSSITIEYFKELENKLYGK